MSRFSLRRDPIRLAVSGETWRSAGYLLGYVVTGWVLFAIVLTAVVTATVLTITVAGIVLLIAAGAVARGCANFERARLRTIDQEPVEGRYRQVTGSGLMARLRTQWHDPATWRDIAYLVGLFAPLMVLDLAVVTIWLVFLAGITLPIWYWAPRQTFGFGVNSGSAHGVQFGYFPNGPHGHPGYGLYVDTLPKAFLAAAICLVLFLLFNYVLVATARLHAKVARALLSPQEDPLREAKEVLDRPGPLSNFIPNGR